MWARALNRLPSTFSYPPQVSLSHLRFIRQRIMVCGALPDREKRREKKRHPATSCPWDINSSWSSLTKKRWNIAKFAPQNIQLWNSREMGQVFGLLGVKGCVVGYPGSEVIGFGERLRFWETGVQPGIMFQKRNDSNISESGLWFPWNRIMTCFL